MIELVHLPVPQTVDAPGGSDFAAGIEIRNAVESFELGTTDLTWEPAEQLPYYQDPARPQRMILARRHREWVGRARYELEPTGDTAWINVEVLPAHRAQGVGRALADEVEAAVTELGRRKAIAYVPIRQLAGAQLHAPTGAGSVPAQSRSVRFLQARGYRLEQVERVSRLPLPVPELAARIDEATRSAGHGYRTHWWVGPTPRHWLTGMADLRTRMSTDVPTAGLEEPTVAWTADEVRGDDANLQHNPRVRLTTAVEHTSSGSLVAFTELLLRTGPNRSATQQATLVSREHRGHRLGLLVKLASLEALTVVSPQTPAITTINAEENLHMVAVNCAIGYRLLAHQSGWRKDLRETP